MKKYTINTDSCRRPIVNMSTGSVIAKTMIPYYNKKTLSLDYISLALDDGGTMELPYSSLLFMNDICTMVAVPEAPFSPDKLGTENLLGKDISAKVGNYTLFSFGTIAATDIDENGSVIALTMADGKTYPVSETGINPDLFLSSLNTDSKKISDLKTAAPIAAAADKPGEAKKEEKKAADSQSDKDEPLMKIEPKNALKKELKTELKSEIKTELKTELKSEFRLPPLVSETGDKDSHNQPKKIPHLAKKEFAVTVPAEAADPKQKHPAEPADPKQEQPVEPVDSKQKQPAEPVDPKQKQPAEAVDPKQKQPAVPADSKQNQPAVPAEEPEKDEQKLPAAPENKDVKKKMNWAEKFRYVVHRFLPPIAAMFIFMILYFMIYHLLIER